ncbi:MULTISPECIES: hypothetical protein [Achromobacter]|uniref:DUF1772 domain-containing protein n=1 Tax=Achromobacter spanius TaxID=217203 RepID=A0ABY8GUG5_9BURK|nr:MULTISPECIES: hypothetical protein [Achromobacter]WAI82290.1 hypothetical protein N8Z00_22560 [Achromobacter spanius]WEX92378.1 hypothetical protein N3Z32_17170 [Achromobacter sp. SS2-2022]WFP08472.1 hypothetical protein P8T11_00965 [Achromobacter spanius]
MMKVLWYAILCAAVLSLFFGLLGYRTLFRRAPADMMDTPVVPANSIVDAWGTIYAQASFAEMEHAKLYLVLSSALLVACTAAMTYWPGTDLPVAAVALTLLGQLVAALPLLGARDSHERRMAKFVSMNLSPHDWPLKDMSLSLPIIQSSRTVKAASIFSLSCTAIGALLLILQLMFSSAKSCSVPIAPTLKVCPVKADASAKAETREER